MKKKQDIIGLPLISIEGAMELGDIRRSYRSRQLKGQIPAGIDKKWYLGL